MSESDNYVTPDTKTVGPSLDQLREQFASVRGDKSVPAEDVLKLAQQIVSAEKVAVKAERDATNAKAKAEYDAKMEHIQPILKDFNESFKVLLEQHRNALVKAEVHSIVLSAKDMHTDKMLVSVKGAGPGLPSAPKASGDATGTRGRNIFTGPDGTAYSTRELLEQFGAEHYEDPLAATGLSHRADQLAEKLGFEKSKRTNGE